MIKKVCDKIWQIATDGCVYFLDFEESIVIDAAGYSSRQLLETFLKRVIDPKMVRNVIFTHLHYDHTGNFDLFTNAKLFASEQEIKDFKEDPKGSVLDGNTAES